MLIRKKDKKILLQIFSSVTLPAEVWAYGSRIRGSAHAGSDFDLVIRSQNLEPLPFDVYAGLNEKIKESNIPILIELRDWAMLPENFHENIEEQYEVLFDNRQYLLNEPATEYWTKSVNKKDRKKE